MNTKCIHAEGVDKLVLSSLLVSIFGIVQSPVDRDPREGASGVSQNTNGLKEVKPKQKKRKGSINQLVDLSPSNKMNKKLF